MRSLLRLFSDREGLARFGIRIEDRRYPSAGDRAQRRVVGLHRIDVIAPRDRDAVLRSFKLRLQHQKILVRFEIWIGFCNR